jgi:hypothetical protein
MLWFFLLAPSLGLVLGWQEACGCLTKGATSKRGGMIAHATSTKLARLTGRTCK